MRYGLRKFFKACLPQILLGPFLNTLAHILHESVKVAVLTQFMSLLLLGFNVLGNSTASNIRKLIELKKSTLAGNELFLLQDKLNSLEVLSQKPGHVLEIKGSVLCYCKTAHLDLSFQKNIKN